MKQGLKIATCCYCGTKAALVLRGETTHELSCASCAAPLHNMKFMPAPQAKETPSKKSNNVSRKTTKKVSKSSGYHTQKKEKHSIKKKENYRSKKKRKSLGKRFFEEVFEVIDDIFD